MKPLEIRQAEQKVRAREVVPPTPRKGFTPRQRIEVLLAAKGRCQNPECRVKLGDSFEIDHVIPLFQGGKHEPSNWQALCAPCHRGEKTPADAATNAKLRRQIAKNNGDYPKPKGNHRIPSRGFDRGPRGAFR